MKKRYAQFRVLLIVGLGAMISGCGGGGGGGSTVANPGIARAGGSGGGSGGRSGVPPESGRTGSLSISFSDAPINDQFSSAILTIRDLRLIPTDPEEPEVAAVLPYPQKIDLLQLASFSEVLISLSVPIDSTYYAVDMLVDSLTLVRADGTRISVSLPEFDSARQGMVVSANMIDYSSSGTLPSFGVRSSNPIGRNILDIEIPLDMNVHENGGTYSFSPLAFVTYPFYMQFRIEGRIYEVIENDPYHPAGAFLLCGYRYTSDLTVLWDTSDRCVVVSVGATTAYFGPDAASAPNGFSELVADDEVVVYGSYDIYQEDRREYDAYVAAVVARGTGFDRVKGVVSTFDPKTSEFTLNSPNPRCPPRSAPLHVTISEQTIIARKHGEAVQSIEPANVGACLGFEAEGVRLSPDTLRAFAITARPQAFRGILSATTKLDLYDLTTAEGAIECVRVDAADTKGGQFHFRSMGAAFQRAKANDLVGKQVVVVGQRSSDACIQAERITYVEA